MPTAHCTASVLLGLLFASTSMGAQTGSSLPATPSTANALPAPIAASSINRDRSVRHRAQVTYIGGLLDVRADNSSLNGILRDIAQATGMKLTGGVVDQRVFGNYGPAEPSTVLATLLDGTGTNMVLRETADNGPRELILTPRIGGATPPTSNAQYGSDSDAGDEAPPSNQAQPAPIQQAIPGQVPVTQNPGQQQSGPQSIPQPWNNVLGSPNNTTQTPSTMPTYQSVPTDAISAPSVAQQPATGIVDSLNPPPAGSTTLGSSTPTNTNNLGDGTAAKTPEQIYQQLQQMRQQSQQQQQPNPQ